MIKMSFHDIILITVLRHFKAFKVYSSPCISKYYFQNINLTLEIMFLIPELRICNSSASIFLELYLSYQEDKSWHISKVLFYFIIGLLFVAVLLVCIHIILFFVDWIVFIIAAFTNIVFITCFVKTKWVWIKRFNTFETSANYAEVRNSVQKDVQH